VLFGVGSWLIVVVPQWLFLRSFPLKTLLMTGVTVTAVSVIHDWLLGKQPLITPERAWTASRLALTLAVALAVMVFNL